MAKRRVQVVLPADILALTDSARGTTSRSECIATALRMMLSDLSLCATCATAVPHDAVDTRGICANCRALAK